MSLLRRQTAVGDSTLVLHWQGKEFVRAWAYTCSPQGGFTADTTRARFLNTPAHNVFCSAHVNLFDGRLAVFGGTAPGVGSEIGTTEVTTFDPSQPDLWTSSSHWAVQDSMRHDRWYPTATQLGDGTVMLNSGIEYFEMPVIGGVSPVDSTGPMRTLRSLGLSRFPYWPVEPVNLNAHNSEHPRLTDHTSVPTAQIQMTIDGRGSIVTFGGIDGTGQPTNRVLRTYDVAVDPYNTWHSDTLPIRSDSPRPAPLSQHAASILEMASGLNGYDTRMFVFGGKTAAGHASDTLWMLRRANNNDTENTWQQIVPSGPSPGPRYGHTMVFDAGPEPRPSGPTTWKPRMYVFGGKRNATTWCSPDTVFVLQLWDDTTWHAVAPLGAKPAARYRHAAVFDPFRVRFAQGRHRMAVSGGAGADGGLLSDMWSLSRPSADWELNNFYWTLNHAPGDTLAVYKHSMILDGQWDRLHIFGGDRTSEDATAETNTGGETNESLTRKWDFASADTFWVARPTTSPILRRSGHTAVYYSPKGVNARVPESFNALAAVNSQWTSLTNSPKFDRETYPFIFGMPGGRVFYAGRGDTSKVLTPSAGTPWGDPHRAAMVGSSAVGEGGTAVLYRPDKLIKVSGNATANAVANVATFSGSSYTWSDGSNTGLKPRANPNSTVLPNGQVLVTGGRAWGDDEKGESGDDPVIEPQAWTPPPTDKWTNFDDEKSLADEPASRGYHSTAILLPDARVLSAGGTVGDNSKLGTIFEPPYLFDPNSSGGNGYANRPTIDIAPTLIGHGCPFELTVTATSGVSSICLIRPGAVTHAFNQDQRFVPLTFTASGGTVTVDGPADAHTAPPGDYLLFVLDNTSRKVPSVAKWVRVTESIGPYQAADTVHSNKITNLNGSSGLYGTNCSQPITVSWAAPRDDTTDAASGRTRMLDLRYSTSSICDNCWNDFAAAEQVSCEPPAGTPGVAQSMKLHGLTIGSYQFRMVSQDDKSATGNISAMSNAKTISVFGCEEEFSGGSGGGGGEGFSARSAEATAMAAAGPSAGEGNSLLPASAGVATDIMRLVQPRIVDGQVQVYLQRGATGETHVQNAALIAADHAGDREVFRVGGEWRLGKRSPALSAATARGSDIASLLTGDRSSCLVGDTGDTIVVTLPAGTPGALDGTIYLEAHSGRIAGIEAPGLRILHRNAEGAWQEASLVLPRTRFSTLVVAGITGNEVRLAFSGNHAITSIGRLHLDGVPLTTTSPAATVSHSSLGALEPNPLSSDGAGVTLGPRERVDLAFETPASAATDMRTWFLEVTGTSTSGEVVAARARPGGTENALPASLQFGAPIPNPFARGTSFRLGLPEAAMVHVEVFDLAGRRVATMAKGRMPAGWHDLSWDGSSRSGGRVAAGIYLCRLVAGSRSIERKLVVMP